MLYDVSVPPVRGIFKYKNWFVSFRPIVIFSDVSKLVDPVKILTLKVTPTYDGTVLPLTSVK